MGYIILLVIATVLLGRYAIREGRKLQATSAPKPPGCGTKCSCGSDSSVSDWDEHLGI